jgi:hypothetical protein
VLLAEANVFARALKLPLYESLLERGSSRSVERVRRAE